MDQFLDLGWKKFSYDGALHGWVKNIRPVALTLAADPALQAQWLRCGGTWFVGVNVLPNDRDGAVLGGGALSGCVIDYINENMVLTPFEWDKAQISVCYRGYPKPWPAERPAAFEFRKHRDAAHLDGLRRFGSDNARKQDEFHRFILGIPLSDVPAKAAPFVVWEGSHHMIRAALSAAFSGISPDRWNKVEVTEIYRNTRRKIFETCRRVELPAKPGESYVIHRMALHGVAPWDTELDGPKEGRMIAYFRPGSDFGPQDWLTLP